MTTEPGRGGGIVHRRDARAAARRVRRRNGLIGVVALAAVGAIVGGSVLLASFASSSPGWPGADRPAAAATPSASARPIATHTPTPTPTPSNDLGPAGIAEIAAECPAVDADALEGLGQPAADAARFFADTAQCPDLSVVIDGTEPTQFDSPLQYVDPACPGGDVLSVWAHYDDDLIFGNPALAAELDAGSCLRALFLSAGDAGRGIDYATGRELGLRAAYDLLLGRSGPWEDRTVTLRSGLTATVTRPAGDDRVSLLFLRLPDGGLDGAGFSATGRESLARLVAGELDAMHSIDTGAAMSLDQLVAAVTELSESYRPTRFLANLPGFASGSEGDHPDHQSVGTIVATAMERTPDAFGETVDFAQGYGVRDRPENLSSAELDRKLEMFIAYAAYDPQIGCATPESCLARRNFGEWLPHQYLIPRAEVVAR